MMLWVPVPWNPMGMETPKTWGEESGKKKRIHRKTSFQSGPLCFKKQTVYVQSNWDPYYQKKYII